MAIKTRSTYFPDRAEEERRNRIQSLRGDAGLPGSLVLDAGNTSSDTSAIGVKTVTISQSLTGPAKYWLASVTSAGPTFVSGAGIGLTGFVSGVGVWTGYLGLVATAAVAGALPDPFGAATLANNLAIVTIRHV